MLCSGKNLCFFENLKKYIHTFVWGDIRSFHRRILVRIFKTGLSNGYANKFNLFYAASV